MSITVTEIEVVDAVMAGIDRRLHTDMTDYDNWVGIRDLGRLVYSILSGERTTTTDEKLRLTNRPPKYRHLILKGSDHGYSNRIRNCRLSMWHGKHGYCMPL